MRTAVDSTSRAASDTRRTVDERELLSRAGLARFVLAAGLVSFASWLTIWCAVGTAIATALILILIYCCWRTAATAVTLPGVSQVPRSSTWRLRNYAQPVRFLWVLLAVAAMLVTALVYRELLGGTFILVVAVCGILLTSLLIAGGFESPLPSAVSEARRRDWRRLLESGTRRRVVRRCSVVAAVSAFAFALMARVLVLTARQRLEQGVRPGASRIYYDAVAITRWLDDALTGAPAGSVLQRWAWPALVSGFVFAGSLLASTAFLLAARAVLSRSAGLHTRTPENLRSRPESAAPSVSSEARGKNEAYFGLWPMVRAWRGTALFNSSIATGDSAHLDRAIVLLRRSSGVPPAGHPDRAMFQSYLGAALRLRFERTARQPDLDEAISIGREAVAAEVADLKARARHLSNLGISLQTQAEQTGVQADLDEAIAVGREAVAAVSADHQEQAMYQSNLGGALRVRFDWTGQLADLNEAISNCRAAAATPTEHTYGAMYRSNLGLLLRIRFDRTGAQADLDDAIAAGRDAVETAGVDHPDCPMYLSNLATTLQTWFETTGDLSAMDEAVNLDRAAVAATSRDHTNRAMYLASLGLGLRVRYDRTGLLQDLNEAIVVGRRAAAATPADHPDRAGRLTYLGAALITRLEVSRRQPDLDEAIAVYRDAVKVATAPPRTRAAAARAWGHVAASEQRWQSAAAGFEAAVELLDRLAPRSLARDDQEHILDEVEGLAADAAACFVQAGQPGRALELFEQSRGVLLSQALDTRTDLTVLTEKHPQLAERFIALRDKVNEPADRFASVAAGNGGQYSPSAERRMATVAAFDRLVGEIRELPEFRSFLKPTPIQDLLPLASAGPVVVVAVSEYGSYALALTLTGVDPLPLTSLAPEVLADRVAAFQAALKDRASSDKRVREAAESRLTDILEWLWDAVAGPVLRQLGVSGSPADTERWPRLWWCLSGLLAFLPVHAAGYHGPRGDAVPRTVLDCVVSSYTPTIRAIAYGRRTVVADDDGRETAGAAGPSMVAVAMSSTPGASDLPGVDAEVAAIRARFGDQVRVLAGVEATRKDVLAALPAARMAHFACHGFSDPMNPSASHLLLQDQALRVVDVAELRLDVAELAFLSACSTARPGERLTDEVIHLTSAFQLAGYRNVIGTLWPIADRHAVDLAAEIYTKLVSDGDVAAALHSATRWSRTARGWDRPSTWASHIHSGP
ncbi:hypothetical protein BCD49_32085 [Pseudofrankia sp. EUN1h]|nr:hypothetical protein BCD49_32085 [Pseudofrankia sp. EUN1h]